MARSTRPMYRSPSASRNKPACLIFFSTVLSTRSLRVYQIRWRRRSAWASEPENWRVIRSALLADVDKRLAGLPPEKRPLVYFARGPRGLQTALKGSINVESIERIGARNVAASVWARGVLSPSPLSNCCFGIPRLSLPSSQLLSRRQALTMSGKVSRLCVTGTFTSPRTIRFRWLDSPPSVNRLIGLKWLGRVLYPEAFPEDLRAETRSFYSLFYHRAPDERQLERITERHGARPVMQRVARPTRQARVRRSTARYFATRGCRSGTAVRDFILRRQVSGERE